MTMTDQTNEPVTKLTRNILIPRDYLEGPEWVEVWPGTVAKVIEEFRTYADKHGLDIGHWDLKVDVSDRWYFTDCSDDRVITRPLVDEARARSYVFGHAAGIGPLPRPDMLHAHFATVEHHRG